MMFRRQIIAAVLGGFLVASGWAQQSSEARNQLVPRIVNFSGKATDGQGKAMSGVVGVTFAIYKEQSGGAALWLETQNVQADAKGNYLAQLGATKPDGLPLDLFTSGEARWLGVTVNGGSEQPRVLLLSVPYALKAADAETLGGLPASAFVLAAPAAASSALASASNNVSVVPSSTALPPPASGVTTNGGTVNALPLWTTSTNIQSSALSQIGTGATAKIGIGTTTPATTLDVKGTETVRGNLSLPAIAAATATAGKNSQPTTLTASSFNSSTGTAVAQNFRWQAEPAANNTATPSGTMNLLYGSGSTAPAETGLKVASNGRISFAAGQTFPGTGTVGSVALSAPGSDFTVTGSPVTKNGTLSLNWNTPPTSVNTANAIVKRDASGNFAASNIIASTVSANGVAATNQIGIALYGESGSGATDAVHGLAHNASSGVAGINDSTGVGVWAQGSGGWGLYAGSSGSQAIWGESFGTSFTNGSGPDGVHGVTHSSAGAGVAGLNTAGGVGVWGESPTGIGFYTPNNVQQARTAGGWVKAMVLVNGYSAPYSILNCFNSTLSGAAATTPPCGINFTESGFGFWQFDFGFEVDDRFLSATLQSASGGTMIQAYPWGSTSAQVSTTDSNLNGQPAIFYLLVF